MAKGGKRPGAGRPKGSTNKVRFSDFVSAEDKSTFVEFILSNYMADMRIAVWLGEQLFGKAPQAIDVTSGGEKLPQPIMGGISKESDISTNDSVSQSSEA